MPPVATGKALQGMGWRQGVDCVGCFGKVFLAGACCLGAVAVPQSSDWYGETCRPAVQRNPTAASTRFLAGQFCEIRGQSADVRGRQPPASATQKHLVFRSK